MKNYYLYIFTVLLLCYSCKNESTKKIIELENQLNIQEKINDSLKNINLKEEKINDSLKNINLKVTQVADSIRSIDHYLDKKSVAYFLDSNYQIILNKNKVVKYVLDRLQLQKQDIERATTNGWLWKTNYFNTNPVVNKDDFLNFLYSKFDRSPENIKNFFTSDILQPVYSYFKDNTLYEDSGMHSIAKAFLVSYQEIKDEDHLLDNLYLKLIENKGYNFTTNMASEEVKLILDDENYTAYNTSYSSLESRIFITYSFWARRHHEGNKEIVYKLLKELHNNLSKENIETEGSSANSEEEF